MIKLPSGALPALIGLLAVPGVPGLARAQEQPAARAAFAKAQALSAATRHLEAAEKLQMVVAMEPRAAMPWYALALARRRAGQCDRAVPAYRRYAELRPAEAEPYYGLAFCLRDLGDNKAAVAALKKYLEMEQRPAARKWRDNASATLVGLEGSAQPASSLYAEAQALRDRGHVEEALKRFEQVVAADPDLMPARAAWGELLLKIRRDHQAVAVFRAAVRHNPRYPLSWYELGFALRETGRFAEAVDAYRAYIKLRPDDPDPYYGLGRSLRRLGRSAEALTAFQTYVAREKRASEQRWVKHAQAEIATLISGP